MKTLKIFAFALLIAVVLSLTVSTVITASENNSERIQMLLEQYRRKNIVEPTMEDKPIWEQVFSVHSEKMKALLIKVSEFKEKIRKEGDKNLLTKKGIKVKLTGYFPLTCTKRQRRIEGGPNDRYGRPLRTLQDYEDGSFVSVATDPKRIKSGTYFKIKEIPDKLFLACDVGSGVRGNHVDICVKTENHAYQLPRVATIVIVGHEFDLTKKKGYERKRL